jgi:hypothetical protein
MLFWIVFCFVFFINIVTPFIASGFNEAYTSHDTASADNTSPPSMTSILGISALNILLVPFWTIGMPTLMNTFIMIPIRALMWYLLLRMIRGI